MSHQGGGERTRGPWVRPAVVGVTLALFGLLAGFLLPDRASAGSCGSLDNPYGPYDYTNAAHRSEFLPRVERHHFFGGAVFEEKRKANVPGQIGTDIDYTLRAFPNHHRALDEMSRLAFREKTAQPSGSRYTVDCWFERAKRFSPQDPAVPLVYSIHLYRHGKLNDAIVAAREGLNLNSNHPELHYNLGLYLFDKRDYAGAREHANTAYGSGYPLQGLRRKLENAGQWDQ